MTKEYEEQLEQNQQKLAKMIFSENDPEKRSKLIMQLKNLNEMGVELLKAQQQSYDSADKLELERSKLEFEKEKLELERQKYEANKSLELEKIKLDERRVEIEQKGSEIDEQKVKIDEQKQKLDKQSTLINWLGFAASLAFGTAAYIWMPKTIMKADQLGEYIDYKALNATDKPRVKLFDKIFRK